MNYYIDDIFFATMPKYSKEILEKFHESWSIKYEERTKQITLSQNLYFIQEYKNKKQIIEKLIPSLIQKIVPEVTYFFKPKLYSIVREVITDSPYDFDYVSKEDKDYLRQFLYFTVLIHPTPVDLAYCARVIYKDEKRTEIDRIIPNTHLGNGSKFQLLSEEGYKSFLTPTELRESYLLYEQYNKYNKSDGLQPKKLKVVINNYLASFWSIWFENSLVIVVCALESLFNTIEKGKGGITRQFENRISIVSKELKKEGYLSKSIPKRRARKIYNLRCDYAHKGKFNKNEKEFRKNFIYLESAREILSGVIKKCIRDPNYGKIFNSYKKIDKAWPV